MEELRVPLLDLGGGGEHLGSARRKERGLADRHCCCVSAWRCRAKSSRRTAARCLQTESLGKHCEYVICRIKGQLQVVAVCNSHLEARRPLAAASPIDQSAASNYPGFRPLQILHFPISFLPSLLSKFMGPGSPTAWRFYL